MRVNEFKYAEELPNTPDGRILLVGMLEDGPVGRGFTLTEPNTARVLFGNNELTNTYEHLIAIGVSTENILFYRINGKESSLSLEDEKENVYLELKSLTGHDDDNDVRLTVSKEGVNLHSNFKEESIEQHRRKDFQRTYRFEEYPTTFQLAEAITHDASLGLHNIIAQSHFYEESKSVFVEGNQYSLTHGSGEETLCINNGIFPDEYIESYEEKFHEHVLGFDYEGETGERIASIQAELIYFPDLPVDEGKELAELAGMVAKQKTEEQNVLCTALFRTSLVPLYRELEDGEYLTEDGNFYNATEEKEELYLPNFEREQFVYELNQLFSKTERQKEHMNYIQIVVGESINSNRQVVPAASFYAGNYITKGSLSPLTNKELALFSKERQAFSQSEVASLTSNGYICSVASVRRGFVTTKAQSLFITEELKNNFYHFRILSFIKRDLFDILNEYIGLPQTYYFSVDVQSQLENYLEQYIDVSALKTYRVDLKNNYLPMTEQEINIDLTFYGELLKVNSQISMTNEGWDINLWEINQ